MARRKFSSKFKTRVIIEALSGRYTIQELARKHEVHASHISQWKAHFLEDANGVFDHGKDKTGEDHETERAKLYKIIGQQKVEIVFFKRRLVETRSVKARRGMVEKNHPRISIVRQCELLGIHRSGVYFKP